jgi:hypothetical protein
MLAMIPGVWVEGRYEEMALGGREVSSTRSDLARSILVTQAPSQARYRVTGVQDPTRDIF